MFLQKTKFLELVGALGFEDNLPSSAFYSLYYSEERGYYIQLFRIARPPRTYRGGVLMAYTAAA